MTRMLAGMGAAAAVLMLVGQVEACSATTVIDTAMKNRDVNREKWQAATDVASEEIDKSGFVKDEITLEAGAGSLLMDEIQEGSLNPDIRVSNGGRTADDWRKFAKVKSYLNADHSEDGTIGGHMRFHIREWDHVIRYSRGEDVAWYGQGSGPRTEEEKYAYFKGYIDWWNGKGLGQLAVPTAPPTSGTTTDPEQDASNEPQQDTSTDSEPLPTPEEIIHHAG